MFTRRRQAKNEVSAAANIYPAPLYMVSLAKNKMITNTQNIRSQNQPHYKKWGWVLDSVDKFSSSADSKIYT